MQLKKIETFEELSRLTPQQRFVIYDARNGEYFLEAGNGTAEEIEDAFHYSTQSIFFIGERFQGLNMLWNKCLAYAWCHILLINGQPAAEPTTKTLFTPAQIELMKCAPTSDLVKGLVMQKLLQAPPSTITDYECLRLWIIANLPKPKAATQATGPAPGSVLSIEVTWRGVETGSCVYSQRVGGDSIISLSADELRAEAEDVRTLDSLLDRLERREQESSHPANVMTPMGDPVYEDHELSAAEPCESLEVKANNRSAACARLAEFLRHHLPEVANRLDL